MQDVRVEAAKQGMKRIHAQVAIQAKMRRPLIWETSWRWHDCAAMAVQERERCDQDSPCHAIYF